MDKYELKLEMAKLKQNKKKSNKKGLYGKILLALVVSLVVLFTIGTLLVFWHTGAEPIVLIGAFFSFFGSEIWILAKIKRDKIADVKKNKTEEDNS